MKDARNPMAGCDPAVACTMFQTLLAAAVALPGRVPTDDPTLAFDDLVRAIGRAAGHLPADALFEIMHALDRMVVRPRRAPPAVTKGTIQ